MRKGRLLLCATVCLVCLMACGKDQGAEKLTPSEIEREDNVSPQVSDVGEEKKPTAESTKAPAKATAAAIKTTAINEVVQGTSWELGNSQGNLLAQGYVCEHEGKVYYQDFNHDKYLCVMNPGGTDKRVVTEEIPRAIQVVGEYVYYIVDDAESAYYNRIKRMKKEGGEAELLGNERAGSMLVTKEGIFFTGGDGLMRMEADGSKEETLAASDGTRDYGWLCIYGDSIITGGVLGEISLRAVKLDGGEEVTLYDGFMYPQVDGDKLYCAGKKGYLTEISITTGEQRAWNALYVNRSVCYDGMLYYTNGRQLGVVDTVEGKERIMYPKDNGNELTTLELYGVAANRLFFTETEKEDNEKLGCQVFKCINLETGEVTVVP